MPHQLMDHYDSLPTNGVLSAASSFFALVVSGIDPVYTGIIMPIALFALGKIVDVVVKVYIERRRR